jgi:cytochrome c oxidase cbb3-type subunit 3
MSEQHQQEHDFDGIEEHDNPLPGWWLGIFWVTIIFSIFYVPYYHFLAPEKLPEAAYAAEKEAIQAERAEAAAQQEEAAKSDPTLTLAGRYEAGGWEEQGKQVYMTNCMACHAADGGGGIGPNMTDDYYIHGGTLEDIKRIVEEGVIAKGMVPWKGVLKPDDLDAVVFYMRAMRGQTAAAPKEPQGQKVDENGAFIEAEGAEGEPEPEAG